MHDIGYLTVRVSFAEDALPVEGAAVIVRASSEDAVSEPISLLTDRDGATPTLSLPTPEKSLSESPKAPSLPYALYDVTVAKDGFYTKTISNLALFSGISATLPVNLIPISRYQSYTDIPSADLGAVSRQNPMLE